MLLRVAEEQRMMESESLVDAQTPDYAEYGNVYNT